MKKYLLLLALCALCMSGCGKPFDVKTAPGFVALENQTEHAYRATTPEGVVVGVRVVDDEDRGDIGFWTQALLLQLRDVSGYALLENVETSSADGTKGRLMKFGHDEDGKPYAYWVEIFLAQKRLYIVEAGGAKDAFEKAQPSVVSMMSSVKVKCNSAVSPILASRTCNRW